METIRYRAIAQEIRSRIRDGVYPLGSKLPPISALMEEFGVRGLNTVRAAQQLLVEEGLLRAEQGVGVWVLARDKKQAAPEEILRDLRNAQGALARAILYMEGTQS